MPTRPEPASTEVQLIRNPILPGFHPDPSMIRVGDDFYLATSTFEWFPGVRIFHSRDLVHWRLLTCPLNSYDKIDLRRLEGSCGVWAPCLSHDGQRFHLIYSNVLSKIGPYWDVHNYLITAEVITGPWSDPVLLNQSGFDPSLFHDDDGSKWLVNLTQDPRPGHYQFGGIVLQQYCPQQKRLLGRPRLIFSGTGLKVTEGPHIYKKDGWYYLMTAEGGTSWNHAVTMARSRSIQGPYTVDPHNPMLTAWRKETAPLLKAGHASLVDTPDGKWYLAHLCGRPLPDTRNCILGRETALQQVYWDHDGWLRLSHGGNAPALEIPAPALPPHPWPEQTDHFEFEQPVLPLELSTLREAPDPAWLSLTERPGWLRLRGRMSLYCNSEQSLVGKRVAHFSCSAETLLDYEPESLLQTAGLSAFYDDQHWYYLALNFCPDRGKLLVLLVNTDQKLSYAAEPLAIPSGPIELRLTLHHGLYQASWRIAKAPHWQNYGPPLDASLLSDDNGKRFRFTGTFFVLCAQDHSGLATNADFDYLRYRSFSR